MEDMSIGKVVHKEGVAAIQNGIAGPLWGNHWPKFGQEMYAPMNVTHRDNAAYPVRVGILLRAYLEHTNVWV
jgi:hypothetical protein